MQYELRVVEHGVADATGETRRTELGPRARTVEEWRQRFPTMEVCLTDPEGGVHRVDLDRWRDANPLTLVSISVWFQDPRLVGTRDHDPPPQSASPNDL